MIMQTFHTKDGMYKRALTQEEIIAFAKAGEMECRREILKAKWATMTAAQKLSAIFQILDIEGWV